MKLLDNDQQRWYCYKDDEVFFARRNEWNPRPAVAQTTDKERVVKMAPPRLFPLVTLALVCLNVAMFVLEESAGGSETQSVLIRMGAIYVPLMHDIGYVRLLTAAFLHIGSAHLVANMYALFFIGWGLERVYGHARFVVVYLLSGVVGNILSALTLPANFVAAGASGAILGCLVALVVLQLQFSHVSFGVGLGSAILSLFYNLISGLVPGSGIDLAAHFGGAIGGLVLALAIRPPAAFLASVGRQVTLPVEVQPHQPSDADQSGAARQQTMKGQKRGSSSARVVLASIVLISLVVGVVTFTAYPGLQVTDVRLWGRGLEFGAGSVSGTVTVQVSGRGTFHLQRVGVTLGGSTCSVQVSEATFGLPWRTELQVTQCSVTSGLLNTYLVVSIDGTWAPAGGLTIVVHLSAETAVQWSRG